MKRHSVLQDIRDRGIDEMFYGFLHSVYTPENKTYRVKVGAPTSTSQLETAFGHAVGAAKMVAEAAARQSKVLYLCMSGGADSEAMAKAFIAAKVPFEVRIGRYNRGLNNYDTWGAVKFCETHQLPYQYVDIDLFDHYRRREPFKYALANGCQSPQFSVYMTLASRVGGFPVFAGNPPHISKDKHTLQMKLHVPRLREWPLQRHLDSLGGGVAFFFYSTPEMVYSFLQAPAFEECIKEQRTMTYWDKIRVYNSSGFSILPREKKYGGFERVKAVFDMRHSHLFHLTYDNILRWNLDIIGPMPKVEVCVFSKEYLPTYLGGNFAVTKRKEMG